jgi:hypothetical protein
MKLDLLEQEEQFSVLLFSPKLVFLRVLAVVKADLLLLPLLLSF